VRKPMYGKPLFTPVLRLLAAAQSPVHTATPACSRTLSWLFCSACIPRQIQHRAQQRVHHAPLCHQQLLVLVKVELEALARLIYLHQHPTGAVNHGPYMLPVGGIAPGGSQQGSTHLHPILCPLAGSSQQVPHCAAVQPLDSCLRWCAWAAGLDRLLSSRQGQSGVMVGHDQPTGHIDHASGGCVAVPLLRAAAPGAYCVATVWCVTKMQGSEHKASACHACYDFLVAASPAAVAAAVGPAAAAAAARAPV
jgi:hypothetical protein